MTDDSAIEQRAICLAFPGLNVGEQEVAHLLCSVHFNRTLLRRLGSNANKPIYQFLKNGKNPFAPTGFIMHPSGQCMLGSIAPSFFKPPLQMPVRHGIASLKSVAGLSKGQVASHGIQE
ncbi:hypothetical protein BGX38DRAFT_1206409 [Terfezia claveryi]|nr:hypothetical protein BGX38DRAFT_1206409 [Terfezia claveryi]